MYFDWFLHVLWRTDAWITSPSTSFCFFHNIKVIDSMLLRLCAEIDYG